MAETWEHRAAQAIIHQEMAMFYGRNLPYSFVESVISAESPVPRLVEALRKLMYESKGFLSMADREQHGVTNMRALEHHITRAEALLAEFETLKAQTRR